MGGNKKVSPRKKRSKSTPRKFTDFVRFNDDEQEDDTLAPATRGRTRDGARPPAPAERGQQPAERGQQPAEPGEGPEQPDDAPRDAHRDERSTASPALPNRHGESQADGAGDQLGALKLDDADEEVPLSASAARRLGAWGLTEQLSTARSWGCRPKATVVPPPIKGGKKREQPDPQPTNQTLEEMRQEVERRKALVAEMARRDEERARREEERARHEEEEQRREIAEMQRYLDETADVVSEARRRDQEEARRRGQDEARRVRDEAIRREAEAEARRKQAADAKRREKAAAEEELQRARKRQEEDLREHEARLRGTHARPPSRSSIMGTKRPTPKTTRCTAVSSSYKPTSWRASTR